MSRCETRISAVTGSRRPLPRRKFFVLRIGSHGGVNFNIIARGGRREEKVVEKGGGRKGRQGFSARTDTREFSRRIPAEGEGGGGRNTASAHTLRQILISLVERPLVVFLRRVSDLRATARRINDDGRDFTPDESRFCIIPRRGRRRIPATSQARISRILAYSIFGIGMLRIRARERIRIFITIDCRRPNLGGKKKKNRKSATFIRD